MTELPKAGAIACLVAVVAMSGCQFNRHGIGQQGTSDAGTVADASGHAVVDGGFQDARPIPDGVVVPDSSVV